MENDGCEEVPVWVHGDTAIPEAVGHMRDVLEWTKDIRCRLSSCS